MVEDLGLAVPFALRPGSLEAFGLYAVRASGLVLAAPLLGGRFGFAGFKIALVLSVALVLFSVTGGAQRAAELAQVPAPVYGLLAARELVIGVFLGFLLQLAMLAARAAGDAISLEMGLSMANQVDPDSGQATPLVARFYEEVFLVALLSVDGHAELLRALAHSFERAPIGVARFDAGMGELASSMLGEMFAAGVAFAAPILVLMAMLSVGLGLIARTVPQVNVLELGFTLRIAIALVAMLILSPLIEPGFTTIFGAFQDWLSAGLDLIAEER